MKKVSKLLKPTSRVNLKNKTDLLLRTLNRGKSIVLITLFIQQKINANLLSIMLKKNIHSKI